MMEFSKDVLKIDPHKEIERINSFITKTILIDMHKRGAVIGLICGIDSALSALCVSVLEPEKVLGIILPEKEPVYDLARMESTFADGKRSSFTKDGKTYHSLVPDYTRDGGHLNETGREIAAEQLLILMAGLST